ncbi:hypothetical protein [Mycolicibacterium thermoresistibile]|uniref:hypothetical protein n=1 Tax=Mycolicibacterium thermoresistibile TaxID=1797 RepID=UPI0010426557|nr:hypothetical protein [Mycolicibacterium thermoresistibile]
MNTRSSARCGRTRRAAGAAGVAAAAVANNISCSVTSTGVHPAHCWTVSSPAGARSGGVPGSRVPGGGVPGGGVVVVSCAIAITSRITS